MTLNLEQKGELDIACVVNGPIQTNTYFARSGNEAVVIDPAWEGDALARAYLDEHPGVRIVAIICTHCHADHTGGVAGARRAAGESVPFLISAIDAPGIEPALASMKADWGYDFEEPPAPDRLLNEGDTIAFGNVELQAFLTPGHTEGGMVFFCAAKTGNVAFVGDTLFPGAHGRTDLPGGSEKDIILSLGKMAHLLPDDTLCLIGHNGSTTMAQEKETNFFMRRGMRRYSEAC